MLTKTTSVYGLLITLLFSNELLIWTSTCRTHQERFQHSRNLDNEIIILVAEPSKSTETCC